MGREVDFGGIMKAESIGFRYGDQKEGKMINAQVSGIGISVDRGTTYSDEKRMC